MMRGRHGAFSSVRATVSAGGILPFAAQPCMGGSACDDIKASDFPVGSGS